MELIQYDVPEQDHLMEVVQWKAGQKKVSLSIILHCSENNLH